MDFINKSIYKWLWGSKICVFARDAQGNFCLGEWEGGAVGDTAEGWFSLTRFRGQKGRRSSTTSRLVSFSASKFYGLSTWCKYRREKVWGDADVRRAQGRFSAGSSLPGHAEGAAG